jgi:hypothetical protein
VIPALVYALCALTSVACALLLLRNYTRRRTKLLLWSSIAFAGLAINNILLFVDLVMVASVSLAVVRTVVALAAIVVLLYGLVWESVA